MASIESSSSHWQAVLPRQRIEIGLIQVRVAYHDRLYSECREADVQYVKDMLRNCFHTIAEHRGGKLSGWDGDGGAFMFLIEGDDSFDGCCGAALDMLEMVPALNEDVRSFTDLDHPLEVRICCDTGTVTYGPEPADHPEAFVHKLARYEAQVSEVNRVTITERVYRRLTSELRTRFVSWKRSAELEVELYRTPPLPEKIVPPDPIPSVRPRPPVEARTAPASGETAAPLERPSERGRGGAWKAAAVLVGVLLLVLLALWAVTRSEPAPAWKETVRDAEWMTWRQRVHAKLSAEPVGEETLIDALRIKFPAAPEDQAAALRRDQAIADVLLSYEGVRTILSKRFGIDQKHFLGTGLSKPVGEHEYSSASIHEYLLPNLADTHDDVWTWQLQPIAPNFRKTVREILAGDSDRKIDRTPPTLDPRHAFDDHLSNVIVPNIKKREAKIPPVIRFGKFPAKFYSNRMGRTEARRVFASNLGEVWDLTVQEAARLSGYSFSANSKEGDTFFIWVFQPTHQREVVPATWGQVLANLPDWLSEPDGK